MHVTKPDAAYREYLDKLCKLLIIPLDLQGKFFMRLCEAHWVNGWSSYSTLNIPIPSFESISSVFWEGKSIHLTNIEQGCQTKEM